MKYKTLLFDVDNTLLDFDANEQESFRCMMQELGEPYERRMYERYHQMNREAWRKIERREISVEEWTGSRFSLLMRQYGREVDGRMWEKVFRRYLNRGTQLMPHVHQVLSELRKHCRMFVVTNGVEETQVYRMEKSGLEEYFEYSFISGRIGASKPSKEYFDYVKSHISNFDSETTLLIGDSLTSDIRGGYEAGIDTCWLTRHGDEATGDVCPTYMIHDLLELGGVLSETSREILL